ncbi:MAG: hypothetical protein IH600_00035 [Bacteroidetes bacterium]|nr:hypothetical protein [Bacteroidota bacterium]
MLSTSETIKDLEVFEGRRLLRDFYHERRVKNAIEIKTLLECWKLCRRGTEVHFSDGRRVRLETNLGVRLGTRIFLEEIVSRNHYNLIQGLVYAGAMIVLVAVALYLAGSTLWIAMGAFLIEALFLLLLAMVTAYSPVDDAPSSSGSLGLSENLLTSINGSIHEMTNAVSDLFRLISQADIRQDVLLTRLTENISKLNAESTRKYSEKLEQTNALLRELNENSRAQLQGIIQQQQQSMQQTRRLIGLMEHGDEEEA